MRHFRGVVFVLIIAALTFAGCKEEAHIDGNMLAGHWEVTGAKRDNRPTQLLNNAVFQFGENGEMSTNITGDTSTVQYALDGSKIHLDDASGTVYEIGYLSPDSLDLQVVLEGMKFHLNLRKTRTEAQ